ncbi:hypothetical protein H6F74_08350 [Trichocoleus sp. FACHB-90]|uniref:hypothetical protein n=1 Tax=Cyanophyceae TaxID=3028117 RepID=UPI0016889141|nr:hypothetical protein [Trichocoleus sp. FACHB-90]MBD1926260.1 hypothetical protein [Trichocoleus sp. FACHB-90]
MGTGDWGLGIGDWELGIGDWEESNPASSPQFPILSMCDITKYGKVIGKPGIILFWCFAG